MIIDDIIDSSPSSLAPPILRELVRGWCGGWWVGRMPRACVGTAARTPLYTIISSTNTLRERECVCSCQHKQRGVAYSELSDPSAGGLGIVPQPDHTHCPRLVKYDIHTVHLHK